MAETNKPAPSPEPELALGAEVRDLANESLDSIPEDVLSEQSRDSEVVIAFVGAVGVDLNLAETLTKERLKKLGYRTVDIRITREVFPRFTVDASATYPSEFARISKMMDIGNEARKQSKKNGILALGVAKEIEERRNSAGGKFFPRTAYLVHSLKHPDEVRQLREIYPRGFYLIGVHAAPNRRREFLTKRRGMTPEEALELMRRDKMEEDDFGQQIVNTFHLSDFFLRYAGDEDVVRNSIDRFVDIIFGDPYRTPAFSEHAMFLAFAASLRSGDLSRQVGAVVARDGEILGTGANDCPAPGGGLYWPEFRNKELIDLERGRDLTRGEDSNRREQIQLIEGIIAGCSDKGLSKENLLLVEKVLKDSGIRDLTEFGRVVHAEMEALLSCARKGISPIGATIYCTTFPCHNCAKHIVASGIERVVFIEPYLKSKATESHDDSIELWYPEEKDKEVEVSAVKKVKFEPFVGVGPRRFFDLFSMHNGVGARLERKDKKTGRTISWPPDRPSIRVRMLPRSYIELEAEAAKRFSEFSDQK